VDVTATCGTWILWASEDAARVESNACAAAQTLVTMQCRGRCNGCLASIAGCTDDAELEPMFFKKKYEEGFAAPLVSRRSGLASVMLVGAGLALFSGAALIVSGTQRLRRSSRTVQASPLLAEQGHGLIAEEDVGAEAQQAQAALAAEMA